MGEDSTTDVYARRPLLVVQHVPWEGPHVILDSFGDGAVQVRHPLDEPKRTPLPDPRTVRGAIFMGGPMSVNDADALRPLAEEIAWLRQAVTLEVPVLGICLGAQLLDRHDPLLWHLGASTQAMHWHGERFTLPPAAGKLAYSAQTEVQAFRLGANAWGLLFHLEVDAELLDVWLAEPSMAAEAERALGADYRERLRRGLAGMNPERARAVFDEFAKLCALHDLLNTEITGGAV